MPEAGKRRDILVAIISRKASFSGKFEFGE
jgi:hypothetical protein